MVVSDLFSCNSPSMSGDVQGNSDQVILVTGGYDHTIKLWQAHTGVCQRTAQHTDSQVNALDITPDKQLIAAAGYQHIRMYDLSSSNPNPVINYEGVSKNVTGVGFQEEGKWMYTGGEDCSARIWDLRSRNLQCQRIFQVSAPVNCVCLHPNQAELVVGDQSGVIHLWDLKTDHNEQLNLTLQEKVKVVVVWVVAPSCLVEVHRRFRGPFFLRNQSDHLHDHPVLEAAGALKHRRTSTRLLGATAEETAIFVLSAIPEAEASIQDIAMDPEGSYMAAVNNRGHCYIWSLTGGVAEEPTKLNPKHKIEAHQRCALKCKFSPDSTLLVTTSADQTARVWKTSDFTLLQELKHEAQRWVWDAAFSADSQYILTASSDGVARLWNVETGVVEREYNGHQKAVTSLAFRDEIVRD